MDNVSQSVELFYCSLHSLAISFLCLFPLIRGLLIKILITEDNVSIKYFNLILKKYCLIVNHICLETPLKQIPAKLHNTIVTKLQASNSSQSGWRGLAGECGYTFEQAQELEVHSNPMQALFERMVHLEYRLSDLIEKLKKMEREDIVSTIEGMSLIMIIQRSFAHKVNSAANGLAQLLINALDNLQDVQASSSSQPGHY